MKAGKKRKPSLKPININADTWFFEGEKSLHFFSWVTCPNTGQRVCAAFRVPWKTLAKSYPAQAEKAA
jgi:hypothetical protein